MRKLFVLLAAVAVLVGALVVPVTASTPAELTRLAEYYPSDTLLFAAIRTDDDFIAELDSLVGTLADTLPSGTLPVSSLREILNFASMSIDPEGDFDSVFRSWLGDSASIGVLDFDMTGASSAPFIVAVEINDQASTEIFLEANGVIDGFTREEVDGAIVFTPMMRMGDQGVVVIRDDVLLLALELDDLAIAGMQSDPLSGVEAFSSTIARLPEESYNAVIYNDFGALLAKSMEFNEAMSTMQMPPSYLEALEAIGPQVYGATILDGRSLTIDLVATYDDMAALQAVAGMTMSMTTEPIDPTFASHIPAGTPLVIIANNSVGGQPIAQLEALIDSFATQDMFTESDERQARQAIFALETGIRGITGLEADEVFGLFTGDIAATLGLSAAASDASSLEGLASAMPVEFAIIAEATDAAKFAELVEGLATGLTDLPVEEVTIGRSDVAGSNGLVITIKGDNMPFTIEIVIASNEDVFAIGTRRAVQFALAPTAGAGLDSDPAYIEAAGYLLADPVSIAYAAGGGFQPLARLLAANEFSEREGESLAAVLNLISSASVSAVAIGEDSSVARLVWTLPE